MDTVVAATTTIQGFGNKYSSSLKKAKIFIELFSHHSKSLFLDEDFIEKEPKMHPNPKYK